ncbi:MAG: hypothetical protein IJ065_04965 [Eubacterium sp.]|nr:hypothetical protein [Eubacterium sp.]
MLTDRMNERVVKAKAEGSSYLAIAGCILLILAGIFLMLTISAYGLVVSVIGGYLIAHFKEGFSLEYEYTLTNGDIDIAKIFAKNRRKDVRSISADSITYVNYADSDRVKNDLDIKRGKATIRDYSGKADDGKNVAVYSSEGDKESIDIINLDERCINHLREVLKSKCDIKKVG